MRKKDTWRDGTLWLASGRRSRTRRLVGQALPRARCGRLRSNPTRIGVEFGCIEQCVLFLFLFLEKKGVREDRWKRAKGRGDGAVCVSK